MLFLSRAVNRIALMAFCVLALGLSGPPLPPVKTVLRSPKDAANQPKILAPLIVAPPKIPIVTLAWNYTNNPDPNWTNYIEFQVASAPVPQSNAFTFFTNTTPLSIKIPATNAKAFFIVRAHDTVRDIYSVWNQ